jgi:hypothetical protein
MGIELELSALLFMLTVGMVVFGRFEVERLAWRGLLKWAIIILGTVGLYQLVGHWSLLFPATGFVAGGIVHTVWCRKHSIHPIHASPRRRYYELRGWAWPE